VTGQAGTGTTRNPGANRVPVYADGQKIGPPEGPREFSDYSREYTDKHNILLRNQIQRLPSINSNTSKLEVQDLPMLSLSINAHNLQMSGNPDRAEQNRSVHEHIK